MFVSRINHKSPQNSECNIPHWSLQPRDRPFQHWQTDECQGSCANPPWGFLRPGHSPACGWSTIPATYYELIYQNEYIYLIMFYVWWQFLYILPKFKSMSLFAILTRFTNISFTDCSRPVTLSYEMPSNISLIWLGSVTGTEMGCELLRLSARSADTRASVTNWSSYKKLALFRVCFLYLLISLVC